MSDHFKICTYDDLLKLTKDDILDIFKSKGNLQNKKIILNYILTGNKDIKSFHGYNFSTELNIESCIYNEGQIKINLIYKHKRDDIDDIEITERFSYKLSSILKLVEYKKDFFSIEEEKLLNCIDNGEYSPWRTTKYQNSDLIELSDLRTLSKEDVVKIVKNRVVYTEMELMKRRKYKDSILELLKYDVEDKYWTKFSYDNYIINAANIKFKVGILVPYLITDKIIEDWYDNGEHSIWKKTP